MKNIYLSTLCVAFSALFLVSCKSNNNKLGVFTCKVDGVDWSATKETIALNSGGPLNIIGRNDSTTIILNFQGISDVGTYAINDSSVHSAKYIVGAGQWDEYRNYWGSSGSVTITEWSKKKVKGTFDTLKLSNSFIPFVYLTDGSFDIEF